MTYIKVDKLECEYSSAFGTNRKGLPYTCNDMYNCCDCGVTDDRGCGCSYCFSCNACDYCKKDE